MKSLKLLATAFAVMTMTVSSCSKDGNNASDSLLFGKVPAIHGEMQDAKAALKEEYRTCDSESKAESLREKADKLQLKYVSKIEEAAKSLDGKEINFSDGDVRVTAPVSLTFEKFFSKTDLTPYFKVNGSAEAASDMTFDGSYPTLNVEIVGYSADGDELFSSRVGHIDAVAGDSHATVKAGAPVKFDHLQFGKKETSEYKRTAFLKLEIRK